MSVKYRLVKKKNLGKDQAEVPEKMYAQPVYMELVSFEPFWTRLWKRVFRPTR